MHLLKYKARGLERFRSFFALGEGMPSETIDLSRSCSCICSMPLRYWDDFNTGAMQNANRGSNEIAVRN